MTAMVFEPITNEHARAMTGHREVHLWSVTVDIAADAQSRLFASLCERERERARRYVSEAERRRFVVARAALRTLVARYFDTRSDAIHFDYGPRGKPRCQMAGGRQLHFNVSHSGGLALLAFSAAEEVGVDIELVRDITDSERIARRFFHRQEVEQWLGLGAELRRRAFFETWTRKEAYLKALGRGLNSASVRTPDPEDEAWSILSVSPSAEYAAALAIRGRGWNLRCWRLVA